MNNLSTGEVARLLGVNIVTVQRWDASGRLVPAERCGWHRRYKMEDVERLAAEMIAADSIRHDPPLRLLPPREAAAVLGIHPDDLRRLTKEKKIPCTTTGGGHRRYKVEDLLSTKKDI